MNKMLFHINRIWSSIKDFIWGLLTLFFPEEVIIEGKVLKLSKTDPKPIIIAGQANYQVYYSVELEVPGKPATSCVVLPSDLHARLNIEPNHSIGKMLKLRCEQFQFLDWIKAAEIISLT